MKTLKLEFVEFIPEAILEDTLYISMKYKAARHKCACGCQNIIITPISPDHWKMKYNGKVVCLTPSIGNWSFPCRSHYWIINNEIHWEIEKSQETRPPIKINQVKSEIKENTNLLTDIAGWLKKIIQEIRQLKTDK